jgi:hypothetical protein
VQLSEKLETFRRVVALTRELDVRLAIDDGPHAEAGERLVFDEEKLRWHTGQYHLRQRVVESRGQTALLYIEHRTTR